MNSIARRLLLLAGLALVVFLLVSLFVMAPVHPVALLRVVDEVGAPVAGAVILPEGLRTKPGPYVSGWYGWRTQTNGGVANPPVTTDKEGYARVPYPKFVFERIETGTLCLAVTHPDFVADRPERVVATAPPAGAPWPVRFNYLWRRIQNKALVARAEPVLLKKGAVLALRVNEGSANDGKLLAQVSGVAYSDTNFWLRPKPGVLVTRRLGGGPHTVRAVRLNADGTAWYSDVTEITAVVGLTNELNMSLHRGATVRGQLDSTVPRPVKNGRVVAHVWPRGCDTKKSPPQWHGWSAVSDDGEFAIHSMPEGDLEVVAMCEGFISTNGPGQFDTRYPQKHLLGTNDLVITIGMEPTARLEVQVSDDKGKPLQDVRVVTWPNVRYGEWASVILMSDCYNTADWLRSESRQRPTKDSGVKEFEGVSGVTGLAVLPDVPATAKQLAADHPRFTLPAVGTAGLGKRRQIDVTLTPGQTNRVSIQLEPRERSPITHY